MTKDSKDAEIDSGLAGRADLAALFGAAFLDYEAGTPAFIPWAGGGRDLQQGGRYPGKSHAH